MRQRPCLISLTSTPARFDTLGPVLLSLLGQGADGVVLALDKEGPAYEAPVYDVPKGVTILPCHDIGPATKVLPARARFPEADIVYCDDDCLYECGWFEALRNGPGIRAASVFDVARLKRRGGKVAQGFGGVFVPAEVPLPTYVPAPVRFADDLWLSAHFELNGHEVTETPEARACVQPLDCEGGLQFQGRPKTYAEAVAFIHEELGIWPRQP